MTIRRGFVDLPHGQLHYRHAGTEREGRPLLMLHASPGSSRQLAPLIERLSATHRVIAPDTPGNGDSPVLPIQAPAIADYARILPGLLDELGVDRADIYGSHTGASIAAELAILCPDRVGKLVLDGIGLFTAGERDAHLARYAHPFPPDLDGAYLMRAFLFCRDQYLFFPWHERTPAARRPGGLPPPETLHAWLLEVLKAAETYPLAYRAAFSWDAQGRLPQVAQQALVMAAADDPLFDCTTVAASLMSAAQFEPLPLSAHPDFLNRRADLIVRFLKE